jgi:hypothetical protein
LAGVPGRYYEGIRFFRVPKKELKAVLGSYRVLGMRTLRKSDSLSRCEE